MFNSKEWVENTKKSDIYSLIITHAYCGLQLKELSKQQYFEIVNEVELQRAKEDSEDYLLTLYMDATPEALKGSKKSLKGYIEQRIFLDQSSGQISPYLAIQAKAVLPDFLTQNKTNENAR